MFGSLRMVGLGLFLLLLKGPEGGPWDDLARGHFWSSHLPTTNASVAIQWLALCSITGAVTGRRSTSDQKKWDDRNPIKKVWITRDGCACARSESVEVLVVGVYHLVVFPTGAVRLGRTPREIIIGCCGVRHQSGLPGVGRRWGMPGVAEQGLIMPWNVRWQVPFSDEGEIGLSSHSGHLLDD
ncbi:hypothetical protein B296_00042891 [Ensete ventricosum]|uniref:Uncharacterized protein n=1 Tax=Ensete ventricosum TaxID=4639 RepID=A0A426YET2_ENSVE|nr:hypothetical protein B296_00042891 [Ensete ventricosum]